MRLLALLSVLFVLFQSNQAFISRVPGGCFVQKCMPKGSPPMCPQGFTFLKNIACGRMWNKQKAICCPFGNQGGFPHGQEGGFQNVPLDFN
ncbi:unnamed protein product [Caenorhabditis sp. 36 PRJEB53466]|nr:unnamed protein product [Caenorhabditis sp. 36 PRJEB53466]